MAISQETCGELLGELVTDENLLFFLDVVEKYQAKSLESACGSHLAEHFHGSNTLQLIVKRQLVDLLIY